MKVFSHIAAWTDKNGKMREAGVGAKSPIQIDIHAIGMIDRIIYYGSLKDSTATLFRGF